MVERENAARIVAVSSSPDIAVSVHYRRLVQTYGFVHIIAGRLIHEQASCKTESGLKAKAYMDRREPVPCELVVGLLVDRLRKLDIRKRGCLLEGFPLFPHQAEAMKGQIELDKFILVEVPDTDILGQARNRRLDPMTGAIFDLRNQQPPEEVLGRLVHRDEDRETTVSERLAAYHEAIDGMVRSMACGVDRIDGAQHPDAVFAAMCACLGTPPKGDLETTKAPVIAVAGPPYSGVAVQIANIVHTLGLVHVSTPGLLESHMGRGTELGTRAKEHIARGELVPPKLVVEVLKERMCKPDAMQRGCVLDGFPLTPEHAHAMKGRMSVDFLFVIDLPDQAVIDRGVCRRIDPRTGVEHNLFFHTPPEDVAARLVQEEEDTEEQVRERLSTYHERIGGIMSHIDERHTYRIDGTESSDNIFSAISWEVTGRAALPQPLPPGAVAQGRSTRTRHPRGSYRSQASGRPSVSSQGSAGGLVASMGMRMQQLWPGWSTHESSRGFTGDATMLRESSECIGLLDDQAGAGRDDGIGNDGL